jgi:hypothetical protein
MTEDDGHCRSVDVCMREEFNGRGRWEWSADPVSYLIDMERGVAIWLVRAVKKRDCKEAMMLPDSHEWIELFRNDQKGISVRSSPEVIWLLKGTDRRTGAIWRDGDVSLDDPPLDNW